MTVSRRAAHATVAGLSVGLACGIYLAWELSHRGVQLYNTASYAVDDADEWRYTACSRLVEHGYALFSQVFSAQPPVLFLSLAGGMRLFGDSIAGGRLVEIAFGLITLLASVWMAWMLTGPLGAAVTGLLLAISPPFLVYAHAIEAEGPMMALVTLSLALALAYRQTGHPLLPAGAGLVLAAAILTKLFALEALAPAVWIIVSRQTVQEFAQPAMILGRGARQGGTARPTSGPSPLGQSQRGAILPGGRPPKFGPITPTVARTLGPAALFVVCALIPVALELLLVSPAQQWQQVIAMHESAAHASLPDLTPPTDIMRHFFLFDAGLTAASLAGLLALALDRRVRDLGFLLLWLGGTTAMLWLFRPLFPHHPAILVSSMAVAAGAGLGRLAHWRETGSWRRLAPAAAAAVLYVVLLPRLVHDDRHVLYSGDVPQRAALARYVERNTTPQDMVAVDDVAVADLAGRLVPPPLCDPSNVRLRSGYLTAGTLIQATQTYRPVLVLPASGLYQQVPAYLRWLAAHYRHAAAPDPLGAFWRRS